MTNDGMADLYIFIGRAMRARRNQLGMNQAQLAARIGLSRTAVTNIECGRQRLLVHQVYEIAQALCCLPSDLVPKPRVRRDFITLNGKEARWQGPKVSIDPRLGD